jgi:hypothetical protein
VGITDLDLTVSGTVKVNKGPAGGNKLNWAQVTGAGNELPTVTLTMDHTVDLAITNGSIALDAFGFVLLAGTFNLVKQTKVAIDDGKPVFQCGCAEPVGDSRRLCGRGWGVECGSQLDGHGGGSDDAARSDRLQRSERDRGPGAGEGSWRRRPTSTRGCR